MSPPITPGIPGLRLPESWEKPLADLEKRVARLEREHENTREKLDSFNDLEFEENSQVTIPSDAPKMAKGALGALNGVPARHRAVVIVVLGIVVIVALTLLALRGIKFI